MCSFLNITEVQSAWHWSCFVPFKKEIMLFLSALLETSYCEDQGSHSFFFKKVTFIKAFLSDSIIIISLDVFPWASMFMPLCCDSFFKYTYFFLTVTLFWKVLYKVYYFYYEMLSLFILLLSLDKHSISLQ